MNHNVNITTPIKQRLYYFDHLRVLAVMLGIIMHTSIAFSTANFYKWYIKTDHPSIIANYVVLFVHIFYMPMFFFIAGFFGYQMFKKYHWSGLIKNRFYRIAVPFFILMLILIPIHTQDVFYSIIIQNLSKGITIPQGPGLLSWMMNEFSKLYQAGELWRYYNNDNAYWFLYYLLIYYVVILILEFIISLSTKIISPKIQQMVHVIFTAIYLNPLIIGMILFYILSYSLTWYLDISYKFHSPLHILFFYGVFFGLGWFMHRYNSIEVCSKHCRIYMLLTLMIILPTYYYFYRYSTDYGNTHFTVYKIICLWLYAMLASFLTFSSTGLTMQYFNKPNKVINYLAESSYWLYIAQIPIVVLAQDVFIKMPWPNIMQYLCVLSLTLIILLILYRFMVRHTWIGQMLNGTRHLEDFSS